jgi:hypothetical protein
MKYTVEGSCNLVKFITEVNDMIKQGWTPYGDLCTAIYNDDDVQYSQALVKTTTPKYLMVHGENINDFNDRVNELIQEGWKLYGFPFKNNFHNNNDFYQCVIKDVDEPVNND